MIRDTTNMNYYVKKQKGNKKECYMLDYIYHPITIMYLLKYKIQAVLYVYVYHFLIYV